MPPHPPAPLQTAGPPCVSSNLANLKLLLDDVGRGIRERISIQLCDSVDWNPDASNGRRLKKAIIDAMKSLHSSRKRRLSKELPFLDIEINNGLSGSNFSDEEGWPLFHGDRNDEDEVLMELLSPRPISPSNAREEKGSSDNAHETAVSKGLSVPTQLRDLAVSDPRSPRSSDLAFNAACNAHTQSPDVAEEASVQITLTSDGFRGQGIRPFYAPLECTLTAEAITSYIRHHWKHHSSERLEPSHLNIFDALLGMYNQWTTPIGVSTLNVLPDGRRLLNIEIIGLDLKSANTSPYPVQHPYSVPRRRSRQSLPPFKQRRESRNFDDMILI